MPKVRMLNVVDPGRVAGTIVNGTRAMPIIRGQGNTDYACAGCEVTLLQHVVPSQIQGLVFRCPHCGAYSRIPDGAPVK